MVPRKYLLRAVVIRVKKLQEMAAREDVVKIKWNAKDCSPLENLATLLKVSNYVFF
jgi:hypothetical protein